MANGGFAQGIQDAPRRREVSAQLRPVEHGPRAESVVADLAKPTVAVREIGAVVER